VTSPRHLLLLNVPYRMVRANLARILSLHIGIEIYIDNEAVGNIDLADARRLGNELKERHIDCTVHAPFMDLSPGGVDREIRGISRDKIKRAVEIAGLLGAKGAVCHGAYDKWRFDGREDLWLESSIDTWTDVLKDSGDLPVLIENIFEENPASLISLFDYFKEKDLWFCFDTGHFNLFTTSSLMDWLMPLKGKLREFHIHDNHGKRDDHLPVGEGTFPFRELKGFVKSLTGVLFTAEAASEAAAVETIRRAKEFLS
jgi:sugar phosphate isomerase/epimerase